MQLTPSCSLFCRPQVLHLGICRTLTTAVHAFVHEFAGTKKLAHDTAGEMLRGFCSRAERIASHPSFPGMFLLVLTDALFQW